MNLVIAARQATASRLGRISLSNMWISNTSVPLISSWISLRMVRNSLLQCWQMGSSFFQSFSRQVCYERLNYWNLLFSAFNTLQLHISECLVSWFRRLIFFTQRWHKLCHPPNARVLLLQPNQSGLHCFVHGWEHFWYQRLVLDFDCIFDCLDKPSSPVYGICSSHQKLLIPIRASWRISFKMKPMIKQLLVCAVMVPI